MPFPADTTTTIIPTLRYRDALATADRELELSVKTADYLEGVSHFLEKRPPNFPDPAS